MTYESPIKYFLESGNATKPDPRDATIADLRQQLADLQQVLDDKRRLTRELDVAMHGKKGAAKQASLCDLIAPARVMRQQLAEAQAKLRDETALWQEAFNNQRQIIEDEMRPRIAELEAKLAEADVELRNAEKLLDEAATQMINKSLDVLDAERNAVRDCYELAKHSDMTPANTIRAAYPHHFEEPSDG